MKWCDFRSKSATSVDSVARAWSSDITPQQEAVRVPNFEYTRGESRHHKKLRKLRPSTRSIHNGNVMMMHDGKYSNGMKLFGEASRRFEGEVETWGWIRFLDLAVLLILGTNCCPHSKSRQHCHFIKLHLRCHIESLLPLLQTKLARYLHPSQI